MDAKMLFPTGPTTGCAPVMFDSIIKGEMGDLLRLLEDPTVDINEGDEDELTPLHLAVEMGKDDVVRLLIENGAQVNHCTLDLRLTPLHIAVRNNSPAIADLLLASGASINCKNKLDHTPLHVAVSTKNIEMTRLLLFWEADPNLRTSDPRRESPLLKAATISSDLTRLLLESGAQLSHESKELHVAILANKPEIANIILDHLSEPCHLLPNRIGRTPLQSVASHIQNCPPIVAVKLMKRLIALGDDVNYINQFGGVFHILIARCTNSLDPVAIACFDYLLSVDGRNCDKIVPNAGSPLTLALRLNLFYFSIKLIKDGFADVQNCRLDSFKYTPDARYSLKLLHYSGYKFSPLFREHNNPKDVKLHGEKFNEMCDWLDEANKSVMSLKCTLRIFIRNKFKERTSSVLKELGLPIMLQKFVLFHDE